MTLVHPLADLQVAFTHVLESLFTVFGNLQLGLPVNLFDADIGLPMLLVHTLDCTFLAFVDEPAVHLGLDTDLVQLL